MKKTVYRSTGKRPTKSRFPKKRWILGGLAGVVALVAILEITNVTYFFHDRKAVSSTISQATAIKPSTTGATSDTKSSSSAAKPNTATNSTPSPSATSTKDTPATGTAALAAPYGDFVSNHKPGQNGSPTIETSVCTTTPGAKCYIKFTSATDPSVVKTLAAGTADANGTVYWNNWDVKAAGFTSGTWNIEAIATLNAQTLSTPDKITLEVHL